METLNETILLDELDEKLKEYMTSKQFYKIGLYTLDIKNWLLLFLKDEPIQLTQKEILLMVFFAANLNKLVLRVDILQSIWNESTSYNSRRMDTFIVRMRKLLIKDPAIYILTVHGKGYRMLVD